MTKNVGHRQDLGLAQGHQARKVMGKERGFSEACLWEQMTGGREWLLGSLSILAFQRPSTGKMMGKGGAESH